MKWHFHPAALAEYQAAAEYYASCGDGLEFRFIAAIERAIQQIVAAPHLGTVVDEDVRRCLARVFPYAVLYSIEADSVLILAVMHGHREPGYWLERRGGR